MTDTSAPKIDTGAAPAGDIAAVLRDLNFEFLEEMAEMAASLWRSCAEDAYRGDVVGFNVHLRQVRRVTYTVVQMLEEFVGVGKGGGP